MEDFEIIVPIIHHNYKHLKFSSRFCVHFQTSETNLPGFCVHSSIGNNLDWFEQTKMLHPFSAWIFSIEL